MRKVRLFIYAVVAWSVVMVTGCASQSPHGGSSEFASSSDQTESQKRARIRLQLGVGYYQQGQMNVALDEVNKALQADSSFADAHSVRGLIYMDMGERRLAEDSFLQALRLQPNNPDFNNNYGWFLCENGREKDSIRYFESALNNRTYQSPAKALNNAGVCSLKLKDKTAAARYFAEAFKADPSNTITSTNLAKLHYDKGDYERARFYIDRVLKAEKMSPDVLWVGIKTARKLGDNLTETSLGTQLRRRYPNTHEYASYQRGAFDE